MQRYILYYPELVASNCCYTKLLLYTKAQKCGRQEKQLLTFVFLLGVL